ncbi:monosaccharide ABC transporter membrane protein, CUT2 family [Microlunatus sagamiharensis]|uniref:Monosaccharide ABC transporter membrane protein, CUT2 family n=1 Tax=Microlunatus sagamiharensis TaxID=546874 RepID=A0A1H2NFT6_9ACTN|nr:ABC transporter permease [Microlunatus sagamiharensis]SDV04138.1 monosaccharide ABC transporter membrane protein, CUT2 family [Microlunatus sagamiharensis]
MTATTTAPAPPATGPAGATPGRRRFNWNSVLVEGRALIALLIIIAIFAALSDNYLTAGNLTTITKQVAFNAIVALGMLMVILNGGIDLSVGSTVGLTAAVAGNLFRGLNLPLTEAIMFPQVWVIVVLSVAVGMLVGWVNGLLVARLNLAPFITTLGMLYVARGLTEVLLNGQNITNELSGQPYLNNTGFFTVFASRPLGLPISAWVMILFAVVFSIVLTRTPFGRWLYATGSNERAAQLSGVPVKRVQTRIYVLSGLCAGVVGILQMANISSSTADLGTYYELNAIAAVVIGGAALSGGRGTVRGTIIGAFVIGFLANGLVIVGVSPFWQKVITGAVIILAVAVDQIQQIIGRRRNARRAVAAARQGGATTAA